MKRLSRGARIGTGALLSALALPAAAVERPLWELGMGAGVLLILIARLLKILNG